MSDNQEQEYLEDGYVKISRRVFSSKTFSHLNAIQKLITIYLIMMANHQDNKWWDNHEKKFITIKRGSFITSVDSIKKKINDKLITTGKIRVILSTLQDMDFLTIKTTKQYSYITIEKYNLYQDGDSYISKANDKAVAKRQQSGSKAVTTNNNVKNVKNVIKKEKGIIFSKAWKEYKIMRTKIRKPLTKRAEELIINELNKLATDEKTQVAILNQSIMNSWQGVFPLKVMPQDSEAQPKYITKKVKLTAEQIAKNKARVSELVKGFKSKFDIPMGVKGGEKFE